ncbi:MAG: TorF family putative porin [Pseudomonadota bacterium]
MSRRPLVLVPVLATAMAASALAPAGPACAEGWRGSVVLTSDYVQRGVSQTDGDPAVQASVAYWHPTGWYGGLWASSVDTARRYYAVKGAQAEVNAFVGYGRRLTQDWVIDIKAVHYLYLNDPAPVKYDYNELAVSAAWRERLYASLAISPDSTQVGRTGGVRDSLAWSTELSLQQPVSQWLTLMLGVGYYDIPDAPSPGYFYGSTSLALQLRRVTLELGHFRSSSAAERLFGAELAGNRTVLTASLSL